MFETNRIMDWICARRAKAAAVQVLAAVCLPLTAVVWAAPVPSIINLQQALILGAQHPLSAKAHHLADADQARALVAHRQANWPTIGINGIAEQTNALVTFDTPFGSVHSGEKTRVQLQASLRLPLINKSADLRASAAALNADASNLVAKRAANIAAMTASGYYLDILRLRAQIASAQSLHQSLTARMARSEALLEAGKILRSDLLKVRLEQAQVAQNIVHLQGQQSMAQHALADAIGIDAAFEVAPPTWLPSALDLKADAATADEPTIKRDDILALQTKIASLTKSAASVAAEQRKPNLDFLLKHDERRRVGLFPEHETSASLLLSIPIFNAGTNAPRQLALLRERNALEASEVDLQRSARLEIANAKTAFMTAQSLREQAKIGIESAEANVAARRAQYDIGRLQIDEVLTAESELANQRTLYETAAIDILRAWLSYHFASGRTMMDLAIPSTAVQ